MVTSPEALNWIFSTAGVTTSISESIFQRQVLLADDIIRHRLQNTPRLALAAHAAGAGNPDDGHGGEEAAERGLCERCARTKHRSLAFIA